LRTDRAPDAVGPDEHVSLVRRSVAHLQGHAAISAVRVARDLGAVDEEVWLDRAALLQQQLLKVGPIDHARVRQLEKVGARPEWKLQVPIGGHLLVEEVARIGHRRHAELAVSAQPILDAASARARKGELLHDAVKELLVDRLDRRQRVARELDRTAEARKLARLLVQRHVEARLQRAERSRQPADSAASDRHAQRPWRGLTHA